MRRRAISGNVREEGGWRWPNEMSSKVANLIALELGILIAILAWLAFSNLRETKAAPHIEEPKSAVDSFATMRPAARPLYRRQSAVDYAAELAWQQMQEQAEAQSVPEDEEPMAAAPNAGSAPEGYLFTEAAPYNYPLGEEPLLDSADCLLTPFDQFVVYPQSSAIVLVANSQFRARRPRAMARAGGGRAMAAPRPTSTGPRFQPRGGRVAPRRDPRVQPPPRSMGQGRPVTNDRRSVQKRGR